MSSLVIVPVARQRRPPLVERHRPTARRQRRQDQSSVSSNSTLVSVRRGCTLIVNAARSNRAREQLSVRRLASTV